MALPKENADKKYTYDDLLSMNLPERRELINGDIFLGESAEKYLPDKTAINMSPAPNYFHQEISGTLFYLIKDYILKHKGKCKVFCAPADVMLKDKNIVQPDIFVTCNPDKIDGSFHNGAPDWVTEILSPSSSQRDFSDKLFLYRENGVREYWIIDPLGKRIIVYNFENISNIELFTFDDKISPKIFGKNEEPLVIRLSDYFD